MATAAVAGRVGVCTSAPPPTTSSSPSRAETRDAFPHTRRPLPWLLAAFLGMLFFVPIDSTELDVHLPVGSQIDRFGVVALVLAWIWFGGDQRAFMRTRRPRLFVAATCLFLALAVASLLFDVGRIVNMGELTLSEKRFALLGSFAAVCWFSLTALRFEDLRGFSSYLIGLASVTAIGVLVERHTGFNAFYNWSGTLLGPIAKVAPSPTNIHPELGSDGRVGVYGPTLSGLAVATMLLMAMPFAFVRILNRRSRRSFWVNAAAVGLMLAAAAATDRKTALVVPVAMVIFVAFYRPRQVMRLLPVGLVLLVGLVHLVSPGAIGSLFSASSGASSSSTSHRLGDFSDVAPDVVAQPVLGRGYGTLDPDQPKLFRINDDEYIDQIWEVGVVGLLAYIGMILAPIVIARRAIRSRDPVISSLSLAGAGACFSFLVANALFDTLSFPQAPYMFFIVAALTTVAAGGPEGNVQPTRQELRIARARGQTRSLPEPA
jgi:hypothetical protein